MVMSNEGEKMGYYSDYELNEPATCGVCGAFMTHYYFPDRYDSELDIHYDGYDCECRNPRCKVGRENLKHPPYPRNEPRAVLEGNSNAG